MLSLYEFPLTIARLLHHPHLTYWACIISWTFCICSPQHTMRIYTNIHISAQQRKYHHKHQTLWGIWLVQQFSNLHCLIHLISYSYINTSWRIKFCAHSTYCSSNLRLWKISTVLQISNRWPIIIIVKLNRDRVRWKAYVNKIMNGLGLFNWIMV